MPREASGMSPSRPKRLERQPGGLVKVDAPMQFGEEWCKKLILASVVVAVAFRREWF